MRKLTKKWPNSRIPSTLTMDYYTSEPLALIDMLRMSGFQSEYRTDGVYGFLKYPNYKKADEIVCNYVGTETIDEHVEDWKYLGYE